ncbi:MAG: S8 family serine peptidase [Proteobacteria bacterium]|nr:S8 family serine peptidase [Pseudomonadota bacterium]
MTRAALALLVVLLAGCATQPVLPRSATLPEAARSRPAEYLVVTIRNPVVPVPSHAASTPRGYDGGGPYIAGSSALAYSRSLASDYGLTPVSSWPIALLGVHCLVYGVPAGADAHRLAATLRRDTRVESVQPLQAFVTEAATYNDPYAQLQQNVRQMSIPAAHAVTRGGGVRVAIVDTGADVDHPDLRPHAARGRNFVDGDEAQFRADPHGTAVAGVIGAVPNNGLGIVGIAPDVELLIYKACWRVAGGASSCNTFTLAQAIAAAIDAHADIVNLSLAGPSDPLLTRLVRRGIEAGVIFVGAMPRDGLPHGFPADVDGVIVADAVEAARLTPGVVRAPGRDVLSLAPDGHYDFYSGSSLAAAEVSGLIALLKSARPRLTAREAQSLLSERTPADVPDACHALSALNSRAHCPDPVNHASASAANRT